MHYRGERGRKGRECKFLNKAIRTFDIINNFAPLHKKTLQESGSPEILPCSNFLKGPWFGPLSDKPSSRTGGRKGEEEIRCSCTHSLARPLSIRFYFTTSVAAAVASLHRRRRRPGGVKYEPSVDAHCCCYVPFPPPAASQEGTVV